jgi:DNA (cytosine-5)-methyltransferase 1
MKFGSVCSGIEAASVAWEPLGWTAVWFSEIEPFPCAVLKHHYPDVPNLGDMTKLPDLIRSGQVEVPDLLCGGTPCQAFSVAGLRQSLDDERGNLSLTFCEIADAIDEQRKSIIFWENVPGVLSTKDNAFGCFLGALAGEDDALVPPGGRWANAGFVDGPKRAVAWRILDAQYFGVAQRRRRVFVVASARADFDPAAVLFEFDGVRRDTAPSRKTGQAIAPCVTNGPPFSRTGNERVEAEAMVVARMVSFGEYSVDGTASAMKARDYKDATDLVAQPHLVGSLCARTGLSISVQDADQGHLMAVAQPVNIYGGSKRQDRPEGGFYVRMDEDTSKTLDAASGLNPTCSQGGTAVLQAVGFDSYNHAVTGDVSKTLDVGQDYHHVPNVFQPIPLDLRNSGRDPEKHDEMNRQGVGVGEPGDPAHTVTSAFVNGVAQPMAFRENTRSEVEFYGQSGEVTGALTSGGGKPGQGYPAALINMAVRRLTPVECERLQGFPDNYTNIKDKCPDGPRYKALGNSWAVPVVRWIGERIGRALA